MLQELRPTDVFQNEALHKHWEAVYRRNPIQERINELLIERLIGVLGVNRQDQILDAGCGTGEHTLRLAKRGFSCVGIDISEYAIEKAREHAAQLGLDDKVTFRCGSLDDPDTYLDQFDVIHCRGVLMHIPQYRNALACLCGALQPGGRIAIIENNDQSIETMLVRLIRCARKGASTMTLSDDGVEFRCPEELNAPIWRIARMATLSSLMGRSGVDVVARVSQEFWDPNRFPAGFARDIAARWNLMWFRLHAPARWCHGNVIIGEKRNPKA